MPFRVLLLIQNNHINKSIKDDEILMMVYDLIWSNDDDDDFKNDYKNGNNIKCNNNHKNKNGS